MPINSSVGIFGSVGAGGKNNHNDVAAIQQRLNDLMHPPRVPLAVDGISGRKTRRMIRDFQKSVCKFNWPDGRVDPVGKTIVALNDPDSEGEWAQMSIPQDNNQGGGNDSSGGQPGSDRPKSRKEAIDAAIEHLKADQHMTPGQEAVMRGLLEDVWKAQKGGFTIIGPGGMTKEGLNTWYGRCVNTFKVARIVLTFSVANTAAWSVAMVLSFIAPFLMVVGFIRSLNKAMNAGGRIYHAIGLSYMTVAWANDDWRPIGCQLFIQRNKAAPPQWRADPDTLEKYWREGQLAAVASLEEFCAQISGKAGLSVADTKQALKAILSSIDKTTLARSILEDLSKQLKKGSDYNVGNVVGSYADEVNYPH